MVEAGKGMGTAMSSSALVTFGGEGGQYLEYIPGQTVNGQLKVELSFL